MGHCELQDSSQARATTPTAKKQQFRPVVSVICFIGLVLPFVSTFQSTSVYSSRKIPQNPLKSRTSPQSKAIDFCQRGSLNQNKPPSLLSASAQHSSDISEASDTAESDILEEVEEKTDYFSMNKSLFWPTNKLEPKESDGDNEEDNEERVQQQKQQNRLFDSIIKIYATHKEPDLIMPWQSKHPVTSTSSGFVIEGNRIMTNAHSVEYATIIQVQKRGDPTKYRAAVEVIANECDLAILNVLEQDIDDDDEECNFKSDDVSMNGSQDDTNDEVEMENAEENPSQENEGKRHNMEFWAGLDEHPLRFGPLPELQEEVEVIGYPEGGSGLSITSGVVSRVELNEYAQSGMHLLAIQIDAAINAGNSGGPVVNDEGKVVGVAFQSLERAENIGYVVPVTIVQHVLEDVRRNGKYTSFCRLGARFAYLENPSVREYLKLPKRFRGAGVTIRRCYPTCFSKDYLKPNDVILSMDGIPISQDGNIPFRTGERVSLMSYIQTKFMGDTLKLEVWRKDNNDEPGLHTIDVPVSPTVSLVPQHWDNEPPPYLVMAGFVFAPLSIPYLEACNAWRDYISDPISNLLGFVRQAQEEEGEEIVTLVQVLAHPLNLGYDELCDIQLKTFNNVKVKSLKHLNELIEACRNEPNNGQNDFVKLEFGSSGNVVILKRSSIPSATRQICKQFSIPNPYFDARE